MSGYSPYFIDEDWYEPPPTRLPDPPHAHHCRYSRRRNARLAVHRRGLPCRCVHGLPGPR